MSCKRKIWGFAAFCVVLLTRLTASGTTATTTTTLAVTSGGGVVTMVPASSVVTLTATVTAGSSAVTTGRVNFCDAAATHCTDIHLLGTAQLTSAGTAALKFVPGIGNHSYKAVFAGTVSSTTANTSSSSNASSLEVTGSYPTTSTITQSGSTGNYSLTATVVGTGSQAALSGSVSFLDTSNANYALGTAPLGTGIAALKFANPSNPATSSYPSAIAVGDFNGDGINDVVIATISTNSVQVFVGHGDGTFTAGVSVAVGNQPNYIAVGDFNGDGLPDLAVSSTTDNAITILLGKGDGTFTIGTPVGGNGPIVVADFNGDGIADMALTSNFTYQAGVLLGNGDGTFRSAGTTPLVGPTVDSMTVADFNGDGIPDLATTTSLSTAVTVLLGNGDGTFVVAPRSSLAGPGPSSIAVADFNEDGQADLAVSNNGGSTITVLLGNGNGTFTTAASPSVSLFPGFVSVGDFNGDGIPDMAVPNTAVGTVAVLLGKGDGTFLPLVSTATGDQVVSMAVGDFNGDGISDLAVGNFTHSVVTVLLPQFTQTTTANVSGIALVGTGTHQVEASYSGDSNYGASVSSMVGLTAQPVATTLSLNANPSSITSGQQAALTATLSPYTVQGHSTDGEPVTFSNGGSTLGTVILASGVATLNVTSLPAGSDNITAAYGGDTNFSASQSSASTIVVAPPIPPAVSVSATTTNLTISAPGGSATDSLQISSLGGFSGAVNLTCKVTYAGPGTANDLPGCNLSPQQGAVAVGSSLSSTLTVTTTGSSAKLDEIWEPSGAVLATVFLLGLLPRRRWKGISLLVLGAVVAACGAIGCGGGGGSGSGGNSNPGTTPGNYQVVVTASDSSLTASTTISLTLQ
jgi:hypothetical protein